MAEAKAKKKRTKLTPKKRKKIVADYTLLGSYRKAAEVNGVSPNTVRNIVKADPEFAQKCEEQKNAGARDILSYMQSQTDLVCTIIGNGLQALASPEKMAAAKPQEITTAIGTLLDKMQQLNGAGPQQIAVEMNEKLKELAE